MKRRWPVGLVLAMGWASMIGAAPPTLEIVFPPKSGVEVPWSAHRFGGHTNADASVKVAVNGKPLTVYETGAFAGLFNLDVGSNEFEFVASRGAERTVRRLVIKRAAPPVAIPAGARRFGEASQFQPSEDCLLRPGDRIAVRCVAGAGLPVVFKVGAATKYYPMEETSPGTYEGEFEILRDDRLNEARVTFLFQEKKGGGASTVSTLKDVAPGKITVVDDRTPQVVRIKEEAAWLYQAPAGYGRLARAPQGTRLRVTGRRGERVRVALAPSRQAWVFGKEIETLPAGSRVPSVEASSVEVLSGGSRASLAVACRAPVPYAATPHVDGLGLSIRLHDVDAGSLWVRRKDAPSAEGQGALVDVDQQTPEQGVVDYSLRLSRTLWGYRVSHDNGATRAEVRVRPPMEGTADAPLAGLTICLDPGHGGPDKGALGATGLTEKEINLTLALELERRLMAKGAKTLLTRRSDKELSLGDRLEAARGADADLFISVHCNAVGAASDPLSASGPSVHFYHAPSQLLARHVFDRLGATESAKAAGAYGVVQQSLHVTREETWFPSILIEFCFLSNPKDETRLCSASETGQMAEAVCQGVIDAVGAY